ncbi:MAG: glutathione S-transferase family protein [Alphaproteobacteria bacterium]|nr:MAG: glutathione S-transferase family protein [Alphaproteobacteria bacterium]
MILTGQLDSPFVRRVAIAMHHYGLLFEHHVISAYDDFGELLALNPLGRVPALQLEDGTVLTDSTLILDYLDRLAEPDKVLLPEVAAVRAHLLRHLGIALGLAEKAVEFRTETVRRAEEKIDAGRVARIRAQIAACLTWLEAHTPENGYLAGDRLTHGDIASAVAMTFILAKNPEHLEAGDGGAEKVYPNLMDHRRRCETFLAFRSAPFPDDA